MGAWESRWWVVGRSEQSISNQEAEIEREARLATFVTTIFRILTKGGKKKNINQGENNLIHLEGGPLMIYGPPI